MRILLILFFILLKLTTYSQNKEIDLNKILIIESEFQKILNSDDDSLKLEAIEYLLSKKGDKKINTTWNGYINPSDRKKYNKSTTSYLEYSFATNQLVALYLISVLYHSDIEFCKKIEIEYINEEGKTINTTNLKGKYRPRQKERVRGYKFMKMKFKLVDNDVVMKMYDFYEDWFEKVKENGLKNTASPLNNTSIKWK